MSDTPGLTDAEKLAALDTYIKVLTETARKLRTSVTEDMSVRHVEKVGAFLPDGTKIASVTRSGGKKTAQVADADAALAWCQHRYPDEVVTVKMIRPSFQTRLLTLAGSLPVGSQGVDPFTGEELPFIKVVTGSPYVTVTKTDDGVARMTALANGFTGMLEGAPKPGTGQSADFLSASEIGDYDS